MTEVRMGVQIYILYKPFQNTDNCRNLAIIDYLSC